MEYAYLVLTLNPTELPHIVVPPELCAHWASWTLFVTRAARNMVLEQGTRNKEQDIAYVFSNHTGSIISVVCIFFPTLCTLAMLSLLSSLYTTLYKKLKDLLRRSPRSKCPQIYNRLEWTTVALIGCPSRFLAQFTISEMRIVVRKISREKMDLLLMWLGRC